jgi:hypothetical protein
VDLVLERPEHIDSGLFLFTNIFLNENGGEEVITKIPEFFELQFYLFNPNQLKAKNKPLPLSNF